MCVYICVYVCAYIGVCICVYVYVGVYVYICIYIYACVYIRMCMYILTCMSSSYTNFIHDGVLYHLFLSFLNVFYFITILSMLSFYIELTFLICSFYVTITLRVCVYLYSCVRKCYCACYFILCIELQIFFYCTFVLLSQQWLNKDAQSINHIYTYHCLYHFSLNVLLYVCFMYHYFVPCIYMYLYVYMYIYLSIYLLKVGD